MAQNNGNQPAQVDPQQYLCPRVRNVPSTEDFNVCPISGSCNLNDPVCLNRSGSDDLLQEYAPQDEGSSLSYESWFAGLTGDQPLKNKNAPEIFLTKAAISEDQRQDRKSSRISRSSNQRNQYLDAPEVLVNTKAKYLPNQRRDNLLPKGCPIRQGQHNQSLPQLQQANSPQDEESSLLSYESWITGLPKKQALQNKGAPKINAPITKEVIDLRYPKGPQRQNQGRSFTDNLLSQYTEKPKLPKQRVTYKLGNKTYYYCPYAGLYTDKESASKPSSNESAIPQSQQSSRPVTDVPKANVNKPNRSQNQRQDGSFRPVKSHRGTKNVRFQKKDVTGEVSSEARKQNVTMRNEQPPVRRQSERRRSIFEVKIGNIVYDHFQKEQKQGRSRSQIDIERQNINEAEIAKIVYDYFQNRQNKRRSENEVLLADIVYDYFKNEQSQRQFSLQNGDQRRNINVPKGKQADSGSLGRQAERRNSDMAQGNRPPSGPPTSCSLAGAGCNRRRNQAACQNQKQPPRVWMPTNKPQKKSAFTLTDEQKALVLDNYYPGLIHDAVNQQADFNEIAKKYVTPETAVDGNKAEKGMSLIEAFDMRVKYEQINLTKLLGRNLETASKARRGAKPYKIIHGPLAHPVVSDIILEDNVRATAIPIDLQHYVRATPESDPVRAIACLTRAQQLNDYYKEYKAAQMAAHLAPSSKIEEAALQGVKSFRIDSLSEETGTVDTGSYKSLELVSYIGVTKPD